MGSLLNKPKDLRFLMSALDATFGIVDRCQVIFAEIHTIIQGLISERDSGLESSVNFAARVKWVFKKSKSKDVTSDLRLNEDHIAFDVDKYGFVTQGLQLPVRALKHYIAM